MPLSLNNSSISINRPKFTMSSVLVLAIGFSAPVLWYQWVYLGSHTKRECTPNASFVNPCRPWMGTTAYYGNPGAVEYWGAVRLKG